MDDKISNKQLRDAEAKLLRELRVLRRRQRQHPLKHERSRGQRIADLVAATMGSWRFIIIQTTILVFWIGLNVTAFIMHWDPYPFILLNLALSFQAAYAAPVIMMSQNRQQEIDRKEAENDHRINIKAELEIELMQEKLELLHTKLDEMREKVVLGLTRSVEELSGGGAGSDLRLELFVNDIAASRRFYQDVLGFVAMVAQGDGYTPMRRDGVLISLGARTGLPPDHPAGVLEAERVGRGIEIVLEVSDLDAALAQVKASNWPLASDIALQPWGLRDFRLIDPDGYYVRVTSRPG